MAEEQQNDNMVGKPLFDILSKLPSKSVLRFRCLSKLWREVIDDSYFASVHDKQVIEDPTAIMFYFRNYMANTFSFHTVESETIIANDVFEFVVKKSPHKTCYTRFFGSCNGLLLIEIRDKSDYMMPSFSVIHPINKQCYVLPKLPDKCDDKVVCGLGFDSSTNTFKMVCVYSNPNHPFDYRTMVHVFGTNKWRKIPQVPSYPILYGGAIFAHGCLHWLVYEDYHEDGARQVIWFDVKNEEFGLIKPPKTKRKPWIFNHPAFDHLVNLDGQVGYFHNLTTEVWVLNHKKEWMLYCGFGDNKFPNANFITVLGCLNKDGDILIRVTKCFYIYNLKNRVIHEARIDGFDWEDVCAMKMVMFPNSLCDIIRNSNLFKKRA